ncbi:hypothetical protein DO72_4920 [Burkholderia pseudomallei]|nr:hypothetical protein DO72_4920 [Burkholderia pseudomallei]
MRRIRGRRPPSPPDSGGVAPASAAWPTMSLRACLAPVAVVPGPAPSRSPSARRPGGGKARLLAIGDARRRYRDLLAGLSMFRARHVSAAFFRCVRARPAGRRAGGRRARRYAASRCFMRKPYESHERICRLGSSALIAREMVRMPAEQRGPLSRLFPLFCAAFRERGRASRRRAFAAPADDRRAMRTTGRPPHFARDELAPRPVRPRRRRSRRSRRAHGSPTVGTSHERGRAKP